MKRPLVRSLAHAAARLVAVAALLVPFGAVAGAASIVYVKDGNVWIASPDQVIQRPVTTDGTPGAPYYSPSQADDGTIVAGWGTRLYRMNQAGGAAGASIPTLLTDKPPNMYAVGPFAPRISPDGATVAYWIGLMAGSYDPACDCIVTSPMESAVFAHADGSGPIGFSRFWQSPSWIGSGHALLFAPDNRQTPQVGIADLAALGAEQGWFNDDGTGFEGYWQNLDEGELDRAGHKLALVRGMQAERLSLYAVSDFTTAPALACEFYAPTGAFTGPSWAPDGSALAWGEGDGVWMSPVPADLTVPGACAALDPRLALAGASEPRWGVADVTPVAPTTTTTLPPGVSTTTTTLPPGEGCAAGCDDDDPCTDDRCEAGACTHALATCEAMVCEIGAPDTCAGDPRDLRFLRRTRGRFAKAARLVRRACGATSPRRLRRAEESVRGLAAAAQRRLLREKISAPCADAVTGAVLLVEQALQTLGG